MSTLEWQDSWSVGNSSLDEDHKRLIGIIQKVEQARTGSLDILEVVSDMEAYTKYHFAREEKLMEEANISDLEEHKKLHQSFVEWISTVRRTFAISQTARSVLIDTVDDFLQDWLKTHILTVDMKYNGLI
jgi:hemerythrin